MHIRNKALKYIIPPAFWLFQFLVFIIRNIYMMPHQSFSEIIQPVLVTYPLDIITFCFFYFLIAPRLFLGRSKGLTIALAVIYLFAFSGIWIWVYYIRGAAPDQLGAIYASSLGHTLLYGFYGVVFRLALDWFKRREEKQELERQNLASELTLLRLQINPHFLFNTLNNIHAYTQLDPTKAAFAIIKLSGIMRYMLYEAQENAVPLQKELSYIEDYIALQELRVQDKSKLKVSIEAFPDGLQIAPMLLMPFIENAFKHGKKQGEGEIQLSLRFDGSHLLFHCRNMKRELTPSELEQRKGIGLGNVRRRLELLYPGNFDLDIEDEEDCFDVKLKLRLQ